MKTHLNIKEDAALCFVLSTMVGLGIFIVSLVQHSHPLWLKSVQMFFYGQVATMMPIHVALYGLLALLATLFVLWQLPTLQMALFDRDFAHAMGVKLIRLDQMISALFALAVIIGIKAVGVALMSGMLIAPAVCARALSCRLKTLFVIAGGIGVLCGALGNIFSYELPILFAGPGARPFNLPTGPLILIAAALMSFLALIFAPREGAFYRWWQMKCFERRIVWENVLKVVWKKGADRLYSSSELLSMGGISRSSLYKAKVKGQIRRVKGGWQLTMSGRRKAQHIVRSHRLFELYLSSHLNIHDSDVHAIAEEMEHFITPEVEAELTELLRDPKSDPHAQPIPERLI